MLAIVLLLSCIIPLSLCASEAYRGQFPTLFELSLYNLKKLPPAQFARIQMLPPTVKELFVTKYGPLHVPTIFDVETNNVITDEDCIAEFQKCIFDVQTLRPIVSLIEHPSCNDLKAIIDDAKTMNIYKKMDYRWYTIKSVPQVDMVAFCPSGKQYAYTQGTTVWLCQLDSRNLMTRFIRCGGGTLKALAFHDNYLFIKGKASRCEQDDLFVWNFLYSRGADCYSLWPENAKFLIDSYGCRIIDKYLQDPDWLTYAFNQILFTRILEDIATVQDLELFKQHQDKLVCGSQSLFKQLTIAEKYYKLKKSKVTV